MGIEKKHIVYTTADIQKYLTGGMDAAEMYAIEKAALDDPFLSEAIEGYEAMEQKDWSKELIGLKEKLTPAENTPVVPLYKTSFIKWWRAAAAILIIASGIAITYLFTTKKSADSISIAKLVTTDPATAKLDSAVAVNNNPVSSTTNNFAKAEENNKPDIVTNETKRNILLADVNTKKEKAEKEFIYTASKRPAGDETKAIAANDNKGRNNAAATINRIADTNIQSNETYADKGLVNVQPQNQLPVMPDYNVQNNAVSNSFTAQVVTADNKPVAFANVTLPSNKKPVYTDANGFFKVTAADTFLNVVVTSVGYAAKKFTLQNTVAQNKIVLQQDNADLNEVVMAKRKTADKKELKKTTENADQEEDEDGAEPSGGWAEYNNYLNNNLVFPNEAKQKNIHGEVEVFIKLKSNGDISKVKVDKTLCSECDAEAIRLVKEGPKWEVKKNKAANAKVKVKF